MNAIASYRPYSIRFWKAYVIQMRPYLLFVSGIAGLGGIAAAFSHENFGIAGLAFIPFFLAYGFGQALTDCFQTDTDQLSAPYRPLSKGEISINDVKLISGVGLLACGTIFLLLNPMNLLFSALSIFGLGTYTFFKRRYWWAGPFYNAWIVSLLPVMGYACMGKDLIGLQWSLPALTFFSYANFVLMGYLKDISADRTTGYKTFPVRFGWNATVWVGDVFVLLAAWFCLSLVGQGLPLVVFWIATGVAVSGQVYGHVVLIKKEENAAFPIAATVRSFILWHLAVILSDQPDWLWFSLGYFLLFEFFLWKRPSSSQI